MSPLLVINVVYDHLQQHQIQSLHRGPVTVLTTPLPVSGADLYAYLNAYSFKDRQPGLNVLLLFEPISVLPGQYDPEVWKHFDYILTHYDRVIERNPEKIKKVLLMRSGFLVDFPITENIDDRQRRYPLKGRKNAICMINGNKRSRVPGEGYSKRVEAALWFHLYSDTPFDVFGNPPFSIPNYKRILAPEERFPTLAQYKYGLCFENIIHPEFSLGYVDKILDCLETRTVPIYLGAPDVHKYVPEGCFIDVRKFKNYRELDDYLHALDEPTYQDYIREIDRWVGQGGLRPYSMQAIYDQLLELLALSVGGQVIDSIDRALEWVPGVTPSLENRPWTFSPATSYWTYQSLGSSPSPLMHYAQKGSIFSPDSERRLEKVKMLQESGKLAKAALELETLLTEGIFDAHTNYWYAQILVELARYEEGLKQLQHVIMLDPGHSLALNDLAALYILKKDYKQGVEYLHAAIQADPHNYASLENLISLLINLGFKDYLLQFTRSLLAQASDDDRLKAILQKYNLPTWYEQFTLKQIKTPNWSLGAEFLREISQLFKADIFVETGTFLGGTTLEAARVFKSVYTIELSEDLYRQVQTAFVGRENIKSFQGDSGKLFPELLKTIKGKIIFWLDGHFSEGPTARSEKNSPILEELAAIKTAKIRDAIILIDDLRMFPNSWTKLPERPSLTGYPTITDLLQVLRDINKDYVFVVLGDVLLAYPYCPNIDVSPVVASCTLSRLFDEADKDGNRLIDAEGIIGKATGEERAVLQNLFSTADSSEMAGLGEHLRLWKALCLMSEQQYGPAIEVLQILMAGGFDHWRLHWYLAQAAGHAEKMALARQAVQTVCLRAPGFAGAQELLKTWERKNDQIGNMETDPSGK